MARSGKIMLVVAVIMCVCTFTASASTHTVYSEGTPSNTYITYFKDVISGIGISDNYVACRSGQYEYILHVSDNLVLEGNTYKSDIGYTYTINVGSGYNSQYTYVVNPEENFKLNTNNMILYSNLGQYPHLEERGVLYEYSTLLAVLVVCVCTLIRPMFNFVNRTR